MNNDCLWVFDEPQLMANGVSTSAQLAGLRRSLETFGDCPSVWMSATLEPGWLDTIDFRGKFSAEPLELSDDDYDPNRPLFQRMTAAKSLAPLDVTSSKDMKNVAKAGLGSGERTGLHQPNLPGPGDGFHPRAPQRLGRDRWPLQNVTNLMGIGESVLGKVVPNTVALIGTLRAHPNVEIPPAVPVLRKDAGYSRSRRRRGIQEGRGMEGKGMKREKWNNHAKQNNVGDLW